MDSITTRRLRRHLETLYGSPAAAQALERLLSLIQEQGFSAGDEEAARTEFTERDAVLITYGDSLRRRGEAPLSVLKAFAEDRLAGVFSAIHVLPFFPYSSDDGFSVTDFHAVDPALGGWSDIEALGQGFELMFDLVINHVSARSEWFARYLAGDEAFADLAIAVAPGTDLSAVTRPRTSPLLTPFRRAGGSVVELWTTFSADQIDLNFRSPETLLRMIDVVLHHVRRGARFLRLDAVGYLWKEIGTGCIHLEKTHEVVRLLRTLLDGVAPRVTLITETNVPHAENISYFGDGQDEAQMVYNFSLPPLCLHALLTGRAAPLLRWAASLEPASDRTTFFNFTASHDGVGLRPLEGLLPPDEVSWIADQGLARGGQVSMRTAADGSSRPYELNVTYVDALRDNARGDDPLHAARFVASQALAFSLPGVPAVYVGSLLGTGNWTEGVRATGQARAINRRKLDLDRVAPELDQPGCFRHEVFTRLTALLRLRAGQPALHPGASLEVLDLDPRVAALRRRRGAHELLALINLSDAALEVALPARCARWRDLLGAAVAGGRLSMTPYQVSWLAG